MNIRDLIKDYFGIDLPIKGGKGDSIENAIIIERKSSINDYVGTEYAVLKYIALGRGIEWKTLEQQLLFHDERIIDKIRIEIREKADTENILHMETYYFDISECLGIGIENTLQP